jgi:excinuclease UvrABC nuclease subunit
MAVLISLIIFFVGIWWAVKYNQDRNKSRRPSNLQPPNYRQMISEREKLFGKTNHPTIEDIQKKYPKRKSQEQLRRESENRLQQERFKELERQQLGESLVKERDLLALVRDHNTCERLLRGLRRKYPNETRLWLIEKAISDIERDRRA